VEWEGQGRGGGGLLTQTSKPDSFLRGRGMSKDLLWDALL